MESVTYLTTSLIDQYENQDCQLETAIVKVFNSDSCFRVASDCLQFLGSPAFMKDHWSNQYQRDALSHILTNEANDNLKLTIALLGLKYAGVIFLFYLAYQKKSYSCVLDEDERKDQNVAEPPVLSNRDVQTHVDDEEANGRQAQTVFKIAPLSAPILDSRCRSFRVISKKKKQFSTN